MSLPTTLFVPKGRINRITYIGLVTLSLWAIWGIIALCLPSPEHFGGPQTAAALLLLCLPVWWLVVLGIKRLRDLNYSLWSVLLVCLITGGACIPLLAVLMAVLSGDRHANAGGEPRESTDLEKLLGYWGAAVTVIATAYFFYSIMPR